MDGKFGLQLDGINSVQHRATDLAGNVGSPETFSIKLDGHAPVTTLSINGAQPGTAYTSTARLALERTDGNGAGVASTEYRLDNGAWTPYTAQFDVKTLGTHRIDFRSTDVLGNVENYRSHAFTINAPVIVAPIFRAPSTNRAAPFVSLAEISAKLRTRSALRNGKLVVRVTCQNVERGTLSLTVTKAVAKRLKLKSTSLARQRVSCGSEGRATTTLSTSRTVKRALRAYKHSFEAKLRISMPGQASDSAELTLR